MALAAPSIPQEYLDTTRIGFTDIADTVRGLDHFARSFAPFFYRTEQGRHAREYVRGLVSDLDRKSIEPIATAQRNPRRPLQRFIGCGKWDDGAVRDELHRRVVEVMGDPNGVLVLDGSAFPKKGRHSVGVARQWCGRLGKKENCQVGVFVSYCGSGSSTLLDGDLYLPRQWTRNRDRLNEVHVPDDIRFRSKTRIAMNLIDSLAPKIPHAWIVGDDEFGRPAWFRRGLRHRKEVYLLEVPSNTLIRDLNATPPTPVPGRRGRHPKTPFVTVSEWAKSQPRSAWSRVFVRDAEKGPLYVEAITTRVRAKNEKKIGPRELLLVTRTLEDHPQVRFYLSNADANTSRETLVHVAMTRHTIEECFQVSKSNLGMDHYEVRSWVGWHHHMTMVFLANWFLTLEHRRMGNKNSSPHCPDGCSSASETAA